jgi:hypothetical protein
MTETRTRALAAITASAVSGITATAAYWIGAEPVKVIAGFGLPIAVGVAIWIAPRAIAVGQAISSALLATFVEGCVAMLVLVGAGLVEAIQGRSEAIFVYFFVLIWYVVVALLLVGLPMWLAVIGLLRLAAAPRPRPGLVLLATLVGVAVVLGVAGFALNEKLMARRGADLRRSGEPPVSLLIGRTTVAWTVVNCSPWPYATTLTDSSILGGPRVIRIEAPGLRTTASSGVVEPGWHLTLELEDPSAGLPRAYFGPKPVVDDVPGRVIELRIEIGARGEHSTRVTVDGSTTFHQVPLCPEPAAGSAPPARSPQATPTAQE